ncbi:2-oxoacid:acceptor oxidoreductase family protein, partial [Candidatus Aerophobetes bacterium]|nr:2-oxoacid:acceptor oxidoreductase family protein [Candidatus Aerophobetes bacterium]
GIIFAGKLLALAAIKEKKEVVFYPSYGIEMRGGAANCTVILSDRMIPSPIVSHPSSAILMSFPAVEKFLPRIKENGYVIVNTSLVDKEISREGVRVVKIPATQIAEELGSITSSNMVALGAWSQVSKAVSVESLVFSLKEILTGRRAALLEVNENALREGWKFASKCCLSFS